jgi:molybdopterin-guanine dinucleotide biosynthesis protein A
MERAAIVLCGGRSRRMGRDKWSLPFGPGTLLDHVVARVRPAVDEIVVVAREGQDVTTGETIVRDPAEGLGPLAGLVAGLDAVRARKAYLAACDTPFVTAEVVRRLFELADGHRIAMPVVDGYAMTTCAVYDRSVLGAARTMVLAGRLRPADLLDACGGRRVAPDELPDGDVYRNCNTPEEYRAALRAAGYAA